MKKILVAFTFIFLLSLTSFSQQTPQPTPPIIETDGVIKVDSSIVQIDFQVLDKSGKPVKNITLKDVEVYQDGKLQDIANLTYIGVRNELKKDGVEAKVEKIKKNSPPIPPISASSVRSNEQGRLITFVVDDGNCKSSIGGINSSRETLLKFVNEQMLPNDKVAIYQTKGGSSLIRQYSSNKQNLIATIKKIRLSFQGPNCGAAFSDSISYDDKFDKRSADVETGDSQKRDSQTIGSIGVLNYVIDRLKPISGRKSVFFLSEGLAIPSESQSKDLLRTMSDKALRSSVVFYTIDVRGLVSPDTIQAADSINGIGNENNENLTERVFVEPRRKELTDSRQGLAELAYATGGDFVKDQNFFNEKIETIIETENGYYLVSYNPEDEAFGGKEFHKIEIKLKNPDLKVQSRAGFYGTNEKPSKAQPKSADSSLYQAISSPFDEDGIEMRLTTISETEPKKGEFVRTLLFLNGKDLTFVDVPNGNKKLTFDIAAVTLDEKSKVVDEFNRTHSLQIPAESVKSILENGLVYTADVPIMKKGTYNFRIVVRDNASKRISSSGEVLEIRDSNNDNFSMSGLITGEISNDGSPIFPTSKTPENAISMPLNSTNSAIRKYRGGDRLHFIYTLYNSKSDNLTTQIRLFSEGKLVVEGSEKPLQVNDIKKFQGSGFLQITPTVLIGEYVLQIVVRDKKNNKTVSQWIDFEVVGR
jgi:VWFA-related protein